MKSNLRNACKLLCGAYVHRKCPPEKTCDGCNEDCNIQPAWEGLCKALSEPVRNCEKYQTVDEAEKAFKEYYHSNIALQPYLFAKWLLEETEDKNNG